jgi:hypothetical protein
VQHNAYHKVDVLEQKVTVHKWDLNFVGQVAPCMVHGRVVLYGEIGFYFVLHTVEYRWRFIS